MAPRHIWPACESKPHMSGTLAEPRETEERVGRRNPPAAKLGHVRRQIREGHVLVGDAPILVVRRLAPHSNIEPTKARAVQATDILPPGLVGLLEACLLYTSDAADDTPC
eukprot:2746262-Pyramimonas_sp.AAC.1